MPTANDGLTLICLVVALCSLWQVSQLYKLLAAGARDHIDTIGHSMDIIRSNSERDRARATRARTFLAVVADPASAEGERQKAIEQLRGILDDIGYVPKEDKEKASA